MRIAGPWIGHLVFDDTTGLGVESADIRRIIRGKPDVAGCTRTQPVRARVWNLRSVFLDGPLLWVNTSEHAGTLAGIPDSPVRGRKRIVRERARRSDGPFLDRDLCAAGNEGGRRLWLSGKILCQIAGQKRDIARSNCGTYVHHPADDVLPAFTIISGGHQPADIMATDAARGDDVFAGTFGQTLVVTR